VGVFVQAGLLADTKTDDCKLVGPKPDAISYIDAIPGYFANVTPDGQYVAYIDYHGKGHGLSNWLVKFDDPKTKIRVPNLTDPVPSPDGQYIATPNTPETPHSGYSLFNLPQLINDQQSGKAVSPNVKAADFEPKIAASYESIGVLPAKKGEGTTYRIVGGSAVFNDFKVENGSPVHVGAYNRAACKNINTASNPNKLPMVSKDGAFIGNYNTALAGGGRTQIYALHDDGSCDLALDLGIPTGKVSFSYDGKHIAFHVDSFGSDRNNHFATVQGLTKNVYVVDVNRQGDKLVATAIRRLTDNTRSGTGSYYPTFTKDGKVVFIQHVDPDLSPSQPLFTDPSTHCTGTAASIMALGNLYSTVCSLNGKKLETNTDKALWTLSLDPKACEDLVKQHYQQAPTKGVSLNDLLAACPGASKAGPKPAVYGAATKLVNEIPDDGNRSPKQIWQTTCAECHNGSQQMLFDWTKLGSNPTMKALIPEMIRRIGDPDDKNAAPLSADERMPYKSKLNDAQARVLIKALRDIENGTYHGE
jgi:mono/diheme cytochrome c family protein